MGEGKGIATFASIAESFGLSMGAPRNREVGSRRFSVSFGLCPGASRNREVGCRGRGEVDRGLRRGHSRGLASFQEHRGTVVLAVEGAGKLFESFGKTRPVVWPVS